MADEKTMKKAISVYDSLCEALDSIDWKYKKHPEDLAITSSVTGDDLPVELLFIVFPESETVNLISTLPFTVAENQRDDMAVALAVANYGLRDGCFEYNIEKGTVRYRISSLYKGSILGKEVYLSMLANVANIVDDYNDKLFMLVKNMMTLDQFIDWEKSKNG